MDRGCWLFLMQALMSILTLIACNVLIYRQIEQDWAKSIMIMIVSVWFPSPATVQNKIATDISQNAEQHQALSAAGATEQRWSVAANVQGQNSRRVAGEQTNNEEYQQ